MLPLIHLGHNIYIPTYIVWISFTYSLCFIYLARRADRLEMPRKLALDLAFVAMIGAFIGARLFSVFYEEWPFYRAHPIEILEVWHGGFVFYGGFFGAILTAAILLKYKHEKFWPWADFFAPVMSLGYATGRIGCLLAGCCYGKICHLPWAITFHHPWLPKGPRHPTEIYASLSGYITFFTITRFEKRIRALGGGALFTVWLIMHATGRIIMEHFRADWRGPDIMGMSISTVIGIVLIIFAIPYIIWLSTRRRSLKPGG